MVSFAVGFSVESLKVTFGMMGAATGVLAVVGVQQLGVIKTDGGDRQCCRGGGCCGRTG